MVSFVKVTHESDGRMAMDEASAGQQAIIVPLADALHLADALCARLCHDLSGPLGTLAGVLDLAADDSSYLPEALPLASETAMAMAQRIRLLRTAWGGPCGSVTLEELIGLAAGLPRRVQLDVSQLAPGPFTEATSRMLVNLMLLGAEALPRGGVVRLMGDGDVVVAVDGPAAAWPDALLAAIIDPLDVPLDDPRTVSSPLVAMMARAAGLRLSLLFPPGAMAASVPSILLSPL